MKKMFVVLTILILLLPGFPAGRVNAAEVGDGLAEPSSATEKDEINTCQVNFTCKMPEGFNLGAYAQFMNETTGDVYQIIATASNDYTARMWVPAGEYTVITIAIWDDSVGDYPMEQADDFVLTENSNHSIVSTLTNYVEIEKEIEERFDGGQEKVEEPEDEPVAVQSLVSKTEPVPWRRFAHTGDGHGEITLTGIATEKMELLVEITKTGSYREGEFKYSTDDGTTWSDITLINGTHEIYMTDTPDGADTGLALNFAGSDTYLVYDEYRYTSQLEYELDYRTHLGKGEMRLSSEEPLFDYNNVVCIRVEQTGKCGEATFKYTLDLNEENPLFTKWSETTTVPKDGVYQLADTGLTVEFWDGYGGFAVGDEYVCNLKTEKSERNYAPYITGIVMALVGAAGLIVAYLLSLKEKPGEYTLNTYKNVVLPKKRGRKEE